MENINEEAIEELTKMFNSLHYGFFVYTKEKERKYYEKI